MHGIRMDEKGIVISQKESNYDKWTAVLAVLSNLCVAEQRIFLDKITIERYVHLNCFISIVYDTGWNSKYNLRTILSQI